MVDRHLHWHMHRDEELHWHWHLTWHGHGSVYHHDTILGDRKGLVHHHLPFLLRNLLIPLARGIILAHGAWLTSRWGMMPSAEPDKASEAPLGM